MNAETIFRRDYVEKLISDNAALLAALKHARTLLSDSQLCNMASLNGQLTIIDDAIKKAESDG